MTFSRIVFLIDIQNGFARQVLGPEQGGSLYVPGGEVVGQRAADLIRSSSNTVFVLSQDFHPAGHISFASSHQVEPFSSIRLGCNEQGIHSVDPDGLLVQTAWPDHCVQGTESAWFVDELMTELPAELCDAVTSDLTSEVLTGVGPRNNLFHVIRKGMRSDLDSYGIATENDQRSITAAPGAFVSIAEHLKLNGIRQVQIAIGGLASNYCVEFSHLDLYRYLIPELTLRAIAYQVLLLADLCAGIDISTPDGSWPDYAHALSRMAQHGSLEATTQDLSFH